MMIDTPNAIVVAAYRQWKRSAQRHSGNGHIRLRVKLENAPHKVPKIVLAQSKHDLWVYNDTNAHHPLLFCRIDARWITGDKPTPEFAVEAVARFNQLELRS